VSVAGAAEEKREIIIVRRGRGDDDDDHHGGVWKIAFADFMTAMMCFFLVMWLINAANEQTKAAVASYFNPVKLIDRNSSRKGLKDLGDGPSAVGLTAEDPKPGQVKAGQNGNSGVAEKENEQAKSSQVANSSDEELFADPYAVLAEIASETGVMQNVSPKGAGGAQDAGPATGAEGGQSYRDPFSPDFWSQQETAPGAEASAARAKIEGDPARPKDKIAQSEVPPVKAQPPAPTLEKSQTEALVETAAKGPAQEQPSADATALDAEAKGPAGEWEAEQSTKADPRAPSQASLQAAAAVSSEIAEAFKLDQKMMKGISVRATDKGVAISITDQLDFGMFEIGSAVPNRETVLAMEKIARVINGQKGAISIEGHTDARPFNSGNYDNWRLSTARAHSAYYMLVRGGVDESRIRQVAGFADRQPKDKADPYAAVNRRIEIILETGG
jgi:chemotaxis protein MotB